MALNPMIPFYLSLLCMALDVQQFLDKAEQRPHPLLVATSLASALPISTSPMAFLTKRASDLQQATLWSS